MILPFDHAGFPLGLYALFQAFMDKKSRLQPCRCSSVEQLNLLGELQPCHLLPLFRNSRHERSTFSGGVHNLNVIRRKLKQVSQGARLDWHWVCTKVFLQVNRLHGFCKRHLGKDKQWKSLKTRRKKKIHGCMLLGFLNQLFCLVVET